LVFGLLETLSPGVNFTSGAAWIFVFLGIIVGLLNVGGDEVQPFLMSGTVLVIVGALGQGILAVVPIFQVT
ncbi:MAG: hypothetical protein KC506_03100, partial [Nanoarchaeota archaeon]|nr:hypothetical protein [Nanoarchaeota archaeon]